MSVADQDQFERYGRTDGTRLETCAVCEALLPEAVDGALSEAEQKAFDKHVAGCMECTRELAEARRGAAWLALLKSEAPEPPAGMLERILLGTTGAESHSEPARVAAFAAPPAAAPSFTDLAPVSAAPGFDAAAAQPWTVPASGRLNDPSLLAEGLAPEGPGWDHVRPANLRSRRAVPAWALSSVWRAALGSLRGESRQSTFQPRLAMTAAMAFFSIVLTLNLTGVRLRDLRMANFTPSGLQRTVADASASATRSFQNNRVVYQVESRVSELRSDEALNSSDGNASRQDSEGQRPSGPSR